MQIRVVDVGMAVIVCGMLFATGCGNGSSATKTPPPQKTLTSISVSPSTLPLSTGASQQLTATATYSDGSTANVTTAAKWTTSNAGIATVNSAGMVTAVAGGSVSIVAADSGKTGTASVSVATVVTQVSLTVSPTSGALIAGSTQQLSATANFSDGSQTDVTSSATWTTSNGTAATVNAGTITAIASGTATLTAASGGMSGSATITVGANVATWHNDNQRSGLNAAEGILTPQNVTSATFGKLFSYTVDGYIYGQPLLVSNLTVNGALHNVVFVATETDNVYAFDASNFTSNAPLWQVSLLQPGESLITNASIQPSIGVTSTPAIDLTTNTMYVVSTQTSPATSGTFRLHALDITTGQEKFGGPVPVQAQVPGTNSDSINGIVYLTTSCIQRPALLLANGSLFIGFGSCHSGWLLSYSAQTLTQTGVFNASPNLNGEGSFGGAGGVWMGGGGPVADDLGNIYITTGNGPYDGKTAFGDSILKFDSTLHLLDHFTPYDYQYMDCSDKDLAAGGLLLIPGSTEVLAGGKSGKLYLANTAGLGGMQANDAGATQTLWFESDLIPPYSTSCTDSSGTWTTDVNSYEIFATSAYFNGSVYLGVTPTAAGVPAPLRQFPYSGTLAQGATTSQSILSGSYGTTPAISAAGTASGVVWMIDHGQPIQSSGTASSAILRAFDPSNLALEIYDSSQNSADTPGYGIKFSAPMVGDGEVFIATGHDLVTATDPQGELDIYGLKK